MKETEMKRVPKLRFPEFTDDWEQRKLGELSEKICVGFVGTCEKYYTDESGIPMYRTGNLNGLTLNHEDMKYVTHSFHEKNQKSQLRKGDILIARHGDSGKAVIYDLSEEANCLNIVIIRTNVQQCDYIFLTNCINSPVVSNHIKLLSAGSTQTVINTSEIERLVVNIPSSISEQKKIAEYFRSLDHLITLHQRKLEKLKELRKGVMKKLFSQEVRFKADDGSEFSEWEKKKIGDVFSKIKDKNKDGRNQNVITNSAEFGLINQRDFFDKDIAVDGKTENYTVIKTGDFVYNPRKSKQAPYGPFNCYQLEENGIVSPLYTCLRPKSNVNDKYLLWYFKSGSWYRFIYENGAQNGARHDRVGMTDSLMQEIPVYLPQAVEEQQKIVECLSALDDVIEKQKATLAAWEELKKGLLQQMFV